MDIIEGIRLILAGVVVNQYELNGLHREYYHLMGKTTISKNILRKKNIIQCRSSMKIALTIFITFAATVPLFAQVSTETELSGSNNQTRANGIFIMRNYLK